MKKLKPIIIFIIMIISINNVFSENNSSILSKIENNIFGYDYPKDTNQNRVERLEKTVYGNSSTGDINKRITKLSGDISADVIGLEIPPVKDTFLQEEEQIADSSVDYPIVNEIEQRLFNTTYKNRDFHTRIVTIEKKLFGKIYDVDDYSTRMDRIKSKMSIETLADKSENDIYDKNFNSNDVLYADDLAGINQNRFSGRFRMPFGQKNYTRQYANYGDLTPSMQNSDSIEDNLSQMEYDIFGTEFSNESINKRMKRLNSVNKAKKSSSKYDSNKFSQHVSTAMEIGAMLLMILAIVL